MKFYEDYLQQEGYEVTYIESSQEQSDIRQCIAALAKEDVSHIHFINPVDNWLARRISKKSQEHDIEQYIYDSPLYLNTMEEQGRFFERKKLHQTTFYKQQRKQMNILMNQEEPQGGQWTYDQDNRKKYPKKQRPPSIQYPNADQYFEEAIEYVNKHYTDNPGQLPSSPLYPANYEESKKWLKDFLEDRFHDFGAYEDAIVMEESILHHAVLSPMLNIGLITPKEVLQESLVYAKQQNIPINSTEGFVRQLIGWREFIRGVYETKGSIERTTNFWQFTRKMPNAFYTAQTGIPPVDHTIEKVLQTGYCHHIERLMILGNFMLLCEIHPDEVYQWFMELFIDAYDWVMVPNIYGMSQFADGGIFSTKPYISGSNYIKTMSDYAKGDWCDTWDALFWRFMHEHRDFFESAPRLKMLLSNWDKRSEEERKALLEKANKYLTQLDTTS
ncbi:cryptochrome/photolyase family protein [Algivirga pacifica]|uniref:Cryptochrome/photolyase family protein n=2 Tax=Algivirga pacifica TaxID=1162670 RepID=A0ABP9D325_9BACT